MLEPPISETGSGFISVLNDDWIKNEIGLLRGLAMNHSADEIKSHLREIIPEYDAQAGPAVL